ncbi:putative polypeptide N-acetylgalactosaminyltransferase 13 [Bactrocera neohumeralis]|uniref:putative polypeptide N-acetylgalactosaminyltransferase 13 n=1 Tax=Bactrocera neohumeralis TaxID=98809 RepID=UPI002165D2CA|nr:putative polypeptide N-acetylgalactosaminyltransferase 13 [Bactrocera neohumeralis]
MKLQKRCWHCRLLLLPIALLLLTCIYTSIQFIEYEYADLQVERYEQAQVLPVAAESALSEYAIAVREFLAAAPTETLNAPWQFYNYNAARSDAIGALRALPDTRDASCTARPFHLAAQRARVSIIIAFHNEARSALLRTVMTLYHRTPHRYLHELILIDDCSADVGLLPAMLKLQLPPFMRNFSSSKPPTTAANYVSLHSSANSSNSSSRVPTSQPQVTIKSARNTQRLGVIASRNRGARLATGDYLLFLDSHCEVNVGWLEPLLERLAIGAAAVSPVLDSINAESLEYTASSKNLMGGFDWNLHFHWIPRPQSTQSQPQRRDQYNQQPQQQRAFVESLNEQTAYLQQFSWAHSRFGAARLRRDTNTAATAFKSPTFAGGIFMISREWFFKLNGFNPLLETWGGESIEFSIKLWLCGGQIEIVPCSRVGHIFRKQHPFRFPNGSDSQTTYLRNSKIIAESWLDAYKYFFYASKPAAKHIPLSSNDTEQSHQLKRVLNCQPFSWYLQNVFPQLKLPNDDFIAFGALSSGELCLHIANHATSQLRMTSCFQNDVTHWYLHRQNSQLQASSGACLHVVTDAPRRAAKLRNSTRSTHFRVVLQPCVGEEVGDRGYNQRAFQKQTPHQRWLRRGGLLVHQQTQLCLDNPLSDVVVVSHCRNAAPSQLFRFAMELQRL